MDSVSESHDQSETILGWVLDKLGLILKEDLLKEWLEMLKLQTAHENDYVKKCFLLMFS